MNYVRINNIILGEGKPKICAPLVERDRETLLLKAAAFPSMCVDVAEWRADWYENVLENGTVSQILPLLSGKLKPLPLLFTFRTKDEGGALSASLSSYRAVAEEAVCSGCIDMIDVELFSGDELVRELVGLAHKHGVKAVLSNHDFNATPSEDEIFLRLERMEALGADIAKIAVTPRSPQDVLRLLGATARARESLSCPVITMSMKGTGLISRLAGELFGSCLTFGSAGQASAPGQIDVKELNDILDTIHKNLQQ